MLQFVKFYDIITLKGGEKMGVYIVVLCFILFDVITGIIKGIYTKKLNSTVLRQGLFHKIAEIITVFGTGLMQFGMVYVDLGVDIPLLPVVSSYICIMEIISIMENLAQVNSTVGRLFNPYLEKLKQKEDETLGEN